MWLFWQGGLEYRSVGDTTPPASTWPATRQMIYGGVLLFFGTILLYRSAPPSEH